MDISEIMLPIMYALSNFTYTFNNFRNNNKIQNRLKLRGILFRTYFV